MYGICNAHCDGNGGVLRKSELLLRLLLNRRLVRR